VDRQQTSPPPQTPLGRVEAIYISPRGAAPMQALDEVTTIAGKGIEGDRYCEGTGSFSKPGKFSEITLIEAEAIAALRDEAGIELAPGASRRNIVTRGVALNHLVGISFRVGDTVLRGIRLCEPCGHLEGLTSEGVRAALVHRGGLRAQIVQGGRIRAGDCVLRISDTATIE